MTVDGYIAGLNGEMDWMTFNWDNELKKYVTELSESVDCMVLGRKLAEGFIPYWASIPDGEDIAGIDKINNTLKVVFTRTLEKSIWENTVLAKGDLVEEITKLKELDGKDIIAYGGAAFVSSLIQHLLVDEIHLFINPVVIGNGLTIFNRLDKTQNLQLINSSAFECGIVVLHYKLKTN